MLFFCAFCVVVIFWAKNYNKQLDKSEAKRIHENIKWCFVALVVLANSMTFAFLLPTLMMTYKQYDGNPCYEGGIWTLNVLTALIAFGFLLYGCFFFFATNKVLANQPEKRWFLLRIAVITALYTCCFLLRLVMFMYRPITNSYLPVEVFELFAYFIPEGTVALVQLYYMRPKNSHRRDTPQSQNSSTYSALGQPELKEMLLQEHQQL